MVESEITAQRYGGIYLFLQTPPHDFYCHPPIRIQTNNYSVLSFFLFSFPDPFLFRFPCFRNVCSDKTRKMHIHVRYHSGQAMKFSRYPGNESLYLTKRSEPLIQPNLKFFYFICYFFFSSHLQGTPATDHE